MRPLRPAAISGWLGLALNVAAVALLGDIASPYRVEGLADWARTAAEHPVAASQSAWCFALGLAFLAAWSLDWERLPGLRNPHLVRLGGRLLAIGALLDAAGVLATDVAARLVDPATPGGPALAQALLGWSVMCDACFNALLGIGILCASAGGAPARYLGFAAGLLSVCVTAQAWDDDGARLLGIAGPLWLTWGAWVSFRMWRAKATPAPDLTQ